MSGETRLDQLLKSMQPVASEEEYVFLSIEAACYGDYASLNPWATVQETEGMTLVVLRRDADAQDLAYESVFRRITLNVHSSLEAVGLTAAFAAKLGEHGISANVIAGFFHDHIFVQASLTAQAMSALQELSA